MLTPERPAASLQERLRAHADLLGVYTDTEAVVADLREAADELERLMANQRTGRIVHGAVGVSGNAAWGFLRRFVGLRWARFLRARTPRERLALVTAEQLYLYDSHLTLVSRVVADELRVWSEPVQFMVEPGRDGLIEFVLRRYEEAKADV